MSAKVLFLAALIAVVAAQHGHHEGHSSYHISRHDGHPTEIKVETVDKHGHKHHALDYRASSHYDFEYKVEDKHTGDNKHVKESRKDHEGHSEFSFKIPHAHHH